MGGVLTGSCGICFFMFGVTIFEEDELVAADEEIGLFLGSRALLGVYLFLLFPDIFHLKAQSGTFGTIKFTEFFVIHVCQAVCRNK